MTEVNIYPIIDLHTCIQGEGRFAGIPHILIRISGCNLRCMFKQNICDTPYSSWFPENGKYNIYDVENLFINNPQISHTFITGGEPFLLPHITGKLIELAKKHNHFVAVETNGTIYEELDFDFVTISPKLSNSVPVPGNFMQNETQSIHVSDKDKLKHERNRLNTVILQKLNKRYECQFKFVLQDVNDLIEINELISQLNLPASKVYLMPEGITNEQIQQKRGWIIEKCIEHGYNYTDRLHIIAYGNKREA